MEKTILYIDRTKPLSFTPKYLSIWRGPKNGNGLEGEEEQDTRSIGLVEVNFTKVLFEHCIKESENSITGEEKLVRHIAAGHIRLDTQIGLALCRQKDQRALRWLRREFDVLWLEFTGTTLRNLGGERCFSFLHYSSCDGLWKLAFRPLEKKRFKVNFSAVLENV